MKIDEIHSLIKFVAKSGVSEIELEMKDFSIKIKNSGKRRRLVERCVSAVFPDVFKNADS